MKKRRIEVNTATEQIGEMQRDEEISDRRGGMKLVAFRVPKKRKDALRIDVADELLSSEPTRKRDAAPGRKRETTSLEPFRTETAIGIAVLAGLVIGYYLGRRRD